MSSNEELLKAIDVKAQDLVSRHKVLGCTIGGLTAACTVNCCCQTKVPERSLFQGLTKDGIPKYDLVCAQEQRRDDIGRVNWWLVADIGEWPAHEYYLAEISLLQDGTVVLMQEKASALETACAACGCVALRCMRGSCGQS
jgi:hypothetical protein